MTELIYRTMLLPWVMSRKRVKETKREEEHLRANPRMIYQAADIYAIGQ